MTNNSKKYASLTTLQTFLDNLRSTFASLTHKHKISDLTDYTVDTTLSSTSSNPIANKTVDAEFEAIATSMNALDLAIDGKANASHSHDDRYFTETEINTKLASKSDTTHNHDSKYDSKGSSAAVQENLDTVSDTLDAHTTNTDIHVTTTNKSNWNSAYTHSTSVHARTDATKVEDSTTNGNIKINGTETNVYSHPNSGVTAGTYKSVTVNAQGHITTGSNPTTLSGYGITDAETKTDASKKLTEAKSYADSAANAVKNDLLNNAGEAYDTLKELGDLIDDNKDAIDALETIAAGKADKSHTHTIANVTGLQSALDGKAATSHGTHVSYSTTAPVMDGTASVGTASTVARSDHKHPTDTSRASQSDLDALETVVSGKANSSHTHSISNITNLQTTLDGKVPTSRTVNGKALSSNITLSASDVGAATSSHTHSYLPLSGGNLTGTLGVGNKYELSPAYNYTNGCLIDIGAAKSSTMVAIHITGNSYNSSTSPIDSLFQFYDYGDGTIMNYSGINSGLSLGAMTAYRYNGRLYAHIKQTADYQTLSFTIITNKSGLSPTVINAAAHTSGYTDLVSITPKNVALNGHTHNYAGSSSAGGAANSAVKATQDASGNVITSTYATKTELNTAKESLQTSINGKANSSHTHTIANITNLQTTLDGKAASSHTHSYAGSSSAGGAATSANKVNSSLTVKLNGGTTEGTNLFTFNGSAAKSVNITPSAIGAATSSHTHDDRYYTESEIDSKLSGKANTSHGNHVPATQTASNKVFLRNDNTWATVTPANIGAAASSHTHKVANITDLTATAAELNYMDGVTSNVQAQLDSKLSTSGGTISGIITTTDGDVVNRNVTTGGTYFYGGTNFDDGAFLGLYGKDQSNYAGQFRLKADNGESFVYLEGMPSGQLRWNNKTVATLNSSGAIPIADGGTGARSSSGALANLGGVPLAGGEMTGALKLPKLSATNTSAYIGSMTVPFQQVYTKNVYIQDGTNDTVSYGDFRAQTTGTASVVGKAQLDVGNSTKTGTAGNARGVVRVYGTGAYYHQIQGDATANRTLTLPNKNGTLATTDDVSTTKALTTAEYAELEQAGEINANTLYMLTDAEEEEEVLITTDDIDIICGATI